MTRDLFGSEVSPLPTRPCPACGAPIMFARSTKGKAIPLDAAPTEAGNVRLDSEGTAHVLGRDSATAEAAKGERLYISHFVTCPKAHQFRKPKGADHAPTVQEGRQPPHAAEPRHAEEAEPSEGPRRGNVQAQEPAPLIGPKMDRPLPAFAPLVAVSDGSQDVRGMAPLAGTPLPAGFRLVDLGDGWTQSPAIEVCRDCGHGTVQVDPQGVPRHRSCERAQGVGA